MLKNVYIGIPGKNKISKSLVRNRVLYILSANAQWDDENRFDAIISDYLSHVTDDEPITARQCIKALAQVGVARPQYIREYYHVFKMPIYRSIRTVCVR